MLVNDLLTSRKLRQTEPRRSVLEAFQEKTGRAISTKELIQKFDSKIDKVTLYRTLHTFEDSGLIHRIYDDSGLEKYALCVGTCSEHDDHSHHTHAHLHFKCEKCLETECISDFLPPKFELPRGYQTKQANFVLIGYCARCSE